MWSTLWNAALKTADTVRTGEAQAFHNFYATSPGEQAEYFSGMDPRAILTGRDFASTDNLSTYDNLLDLGYGSGGFAIEVSQVRDVPKLTVVDLPFVVPVTREIIADSGVSERIDCAAVDMTTSPVPSTRSFSRTSFRSFPQNTPRSRFEKQETPSLPAVTSTRWVTSWMTQRSLRSIPSRSTSP